MGKKLKQTAKLPAKKPNKHDVFNTGDKTLSAANKFANKLNAAFINALNNTNIPIFEEMATPRNLLNLYFMNRPLLEFTLGDNQIILDRIFRDLLATEIATSVQDTVHEQRLPGFWNQHGLMALARKMLNIIQLADHPEYGAYLSAHEVDPEDPVITLDMVKEYPAMTCMRFTDFNPNRLYQYYVVVTETCLRMIMHELANNTPVAYLVTPKQLGTNATHAAHLKAVRARYGNEFVKYASEPIKNWVEENWDREDMTLSAKMAGFSKVCADAILGYSYRVLQTTGLSDPAIDTLFNVCTPKVNYAMNGLHAFQDLATINTSKLYIFFRPEKTTMSRVPGAKIEVDFSQIYISVMKPSKTAEYYLGYNLHQFIIQLMKMGVLTYEPVRNFGLPEGEEEPEPTTSEPEEVTDFGGDTISKDVAAALSGTPYSE